MLLQDGTVQTATSDKRVLQGKGDETLESENIYHAYVENANHACMFCGDNTLANDITLIAFKQNSSINTTRSGQGFASDAIVSGKGFAAK